MKTCNTCGEEKSETEFPWHNQAKGTRRNRCLVCNRKKRAAQGYNNQSHQLDAAHTRKELQGDWDLSAAYEWARKPITGNGVAS